MLHLTLKPEPENFDANVRQPGLKWISTHPNSNKYPDYWGQIRGDLCHAYNYICAYTGMRVTSGVVEHAKPKSKYKNLVYEWSNYRYADPTVNSTKKDKVCPVDPTEINDGDICLDPFTGEVFPRTGLPKEYADKLEQTIKILGLNKVQFKEARLLYIKMYLTQNSELAELAPFVVYSIGKVSNTGLSNPSIDQ